MKTFRFNNFSKEMLEVNKFERRDNVAKIINYIHSDKMQYVCGVIGLRKTGKTTMLLQAMMDLQEEQRNKSLYILVEKDDDTYDLEYVLKKNKDIRNFFIDEATNMYDLEARAATFSDYYAASGCRLVFSGTDSLLLSITAKNTLFHRMEKIKTTWMPWREYSKITGKDFESYAIHGGILGEFDETLNEYVETSIIENLINSLRRIGNEKYNYSLGQLIDYDLIKDVLLRVLDDNTHRFINKVLDNPDLKLAELQAFIGIMKQKINDYSQDKINEFSKRLKLKLGYIDEWQGIQKLDASDPRIVDLRGWLKEMDVFIEQDIRPSKIGSQKQHMLSQPALRWHQILNVFSAISKDKEISMFLPNNTKLFTKTIIGEIVEDFVMLDTAKTLEKTHDVFSWKFNKNEGEFSRDGEFDMVIVEKTNIFNISTDVEEDDSVTCDIFEIKNQTRHDWEQAIHLRNKAFLEYFEKYQNKPCFSVVLYLGKNFMDFDGIMWINLPEFLENLPRYNDFLIDKSEELIKKRNAYDAYMSDWIKENIQNFEELKNEYLEKKNDDAFEIPFAEWLRKEKNINIPKPDTEYTNIGESNWSLFQKLIFDAKSKDEFQNITIEVNDKNPHP